MNAPSPPARGRGGDHRRATGQVIHNPDAASATTASFAEQTGPTALAEHAPCDVVVVAA